MKFPTQELTVTETTQIRVEQKGSHVEVRVWRKDGRRWNPTSHVRTIPLDTRLLDYWEKAGKEVSAQSKRLRRKERVARRRKDALEGAVIVASSAVVGQRATELAQEAEHYKEALNQSIIQAIFELLPREGALTKER